MRAGHNATTDRSQLASMAKQAKEALHVEAGDEQTLTVIADPGYYKGEEMLECQQNGIQALVPKVDTSGKRAKGQFTRADFRYDEQKDEYRCPAGEAMPYKLLHPGQRQAITRLYDLPMPRLSVEGEVHGGPRASHQALGA